MSHYPYSTKYLPSAPVVEIRLGAPGAEPSSEFLEALIDTGADATLVPVAYLRKSAPEKLTRLPCAVNGESVDRWHFMQWR